jgi:hypothetical protein
VSSERATAPWTRTIARPMSDRIKSSVRVVDEGPVAPAGRRHLNDFAVDQLDPVVLTEDSHLGHPVVLGPREPSSCGHRFHCH